MYLPYGQECGWREPLLFDSGLKVHQINHVDTPMSCTYQFRSSVQERQGGVDGGVLPNMYHKYFIEHHQLGSHDTPGVTQPGFTKLFNYCDYAHGPQKNVDGFNPSI